MARKEKSVFDIKELVRQLRLGQKERAIGRHMGFHRKTIRKYKELAEKHGWLEEGVMLPDQEVISKAIQEMMPDSTPHEISGVEPHRGFVEILLQHADMSVTVIYQRLIEVGYTGSYSSVRRFVTKLRGPTIPDGFCRIEVAPATEHTANENRN